MKVQMQAQLPPEKREEVGGTKFLPARQASKGSCEPACCNARDVMNAASMQIPYQTYVSKHTKLSDKVFAAASGLELYICKMQIYKAML